jgi:hypothetical protein
MKGDATVADRPCPDHHVFGMTVCGAARLVSTTCLGCVLGRYGSDIQVPCAAIYADVSKWTSDSLSWAARLLDEADVAVAPGIDFDTVDGGMFIRMCFAGEGDEIIRGVSSNSCCTGVTAKNRAHRLNSASVRAL